MKLALHHINIILCFVLTLMAGCSGKPTGDSTSELTETIWTARHNLEVGLEYDNQRHQMRLAELYYRKAYETLKDDPSQAWDVYAEAGYRYVCLLYRRGDMEGALTVVNEMLDKAEGQKDFPTTDRTGLLSLMAQCQLHLAMPEAAKQTFDKAYQNELTVLGGEEKGDFNLAIMCSNIFYSLFEIGEYDEAKKWLGRYEDELLACEKLGIGDSALIEEYKGSVALYKARYLQATGRMGEAAAVFASIPHSQISMLGNILDATGYLMAAGRYDEAAYWYDQLDSTFQTTIGTKPTFDNIATYLSPRYEANRRAGHVAEALELADKTFAAIDSALAWQKQNDAAELAVIYQTHEKELALEESQAKITIYHILAFSFFAIMIVIFVALWRLAIAHRREVIKNRELYDLIQHEQLREVREIQRLVRQPEQERTPGEQIFLRLVELMAKEQPYTDAELNRDTLAAMLATNHRYIDEAIRECSDALSTNAFINGYRVDHAARLLTQTDEPIALIAEMSGFANRTTFNEQFRSRYKMTPSEYRKAAKT